MSCSTIVLLTLLLTNFAFVSLQQIISKVNYYKALIHPVPWSCISLCQLKVKCNIYPHNISDPNDKFREYLLSNGLNEATVQKLLDEEIQDVQTLGILSEEDIDKLELKTGQKARVRSLTRSKETSTKDQQSDRHKPTEVKGRSSFQEDERQKEPTFVKCSQNQRFPVKKPIVGSKTRKRLPVTKNHAGLLQISSSSSSGEFAHASYGLTI